MSVTGGVVEGLHEVETECLITVQFSNKHSWMRGNSVKYEVEKILRETQEDGGAQVSAAAAAAPKEQ